MSTEGAAPIARFTGERYVPAVGGEIRIEHLHRYQVAQSFVTGLTVADIACGEGYGSAMLAIAADSVIGIDIETETLADARKCYSSIANLRFVKGAAQRLPLADDSIDAITCFETIEHLREQSNMLTEFHRVLKSSGFLMISCPNRPAYREANVEPDPYHVAELDERELLELLARYFPAVRALGQSWLVASTIAGSGVDSAHFQVWTDAEPVGADSSRAYSPLYFVVLCGATQDCLPDIQPSVYRPRGDALWWEARSTQHRAVSLEAALAERTAELDRTASWAVSLEAALAERTAELERGANRIASLKLALSERTDENRILTRLLGDLEGRLQSSETQRGEFEIQAAEERCIREQSDDRLQELLDSTSWKVTGPPRFVTGKVRSRGGTLYRRVRGVVALGRRLVLFRGLRREARPSADGARSTTDAQDPVPTEATQPQPLEVQRSRSRLPELELPVLAHEYHPTVSVVVPAYNHDAFLQARLESIYDQTYRDFEVYLLDDASTDKSLRVMQSFAERFPSNTKLLANRENSGSAFRQWRRGLSLARGEVVWLAESDDTCDPNFLETLVPFMAHPAVMLAFSQTVFFEHSIDNVVWTLSEYLSTFSRPTASSADVSPIRFDEPWIRSAQDLVAAGFADKNVVPNISGAIFRHPGNMSLLDDQDWLAMQLAGDWLFYLELIKGGLVAFSPLTTNYHRGGEGTLTSRVIGSSTWAVEEARVQSAARRIYGVDRKDRHGDVS